MLTILALFLAWSEAASVSAGKIGSGEYLRTHCERFKQHYEGLVRSQLESLPFEVTLSNILQRFSAGRHEHPQVRVETSGWPVLYIVDGELYGEK